MQEGLVEVNSKARLKEKDEFYHLSFSDESDAWGADYKLYFYKSADAFLRKAIQTKSLPSSFCILEPKLSEKKLESNSLLQDINLVSRWLKLLTDMADHKRDDNVLVFFVHHKEGRTKPYELSPFLSLQRLYELDLRFDKDQFEHLLTSWNWDDAHKKERQSVMLASFAEIMAKLEDGESAFELILSQTGKLYRRYVENYELYVNRFSVEEQLHEIDEQQLDFIGKLQDLVASSQTKAFALPGVMVAIAALSRTNNYIGAFSIFVGVIMTQLIIMKSNDLLRDNVMHFETTFKRAFDKYVKSRKEDREVREYAQNAKDSLELQIDKARDRITFIDRMSYGMTFIGIVLSLTMVGILINTST